MIEYWHRTDIPAYYSRRKTPGIPSKTGCRAFFDAGRFQTNSSTAHTAAIMPPMMLTTV